MKPLRLFISSVQKEFADERTAIRDYLLGDALMRRFFEPFLFEFDVPACDRTAGDVYLEEVDRCDLYVGLFGDQYGFEDADGVSATEREFERAKDRCKPRLIFVKGADDKGRQAKMQALVRRAGAELVRRRFAAKSDLVTALYASLLKTLEERQLIRFAPFDASPCARATPGDLDEEKMGWFIREARRARGFPLREGASPEELLTHLNLLDERAPTNAALLLFGLQPQRFLLSSEVKCAHYHGTEAAKPIPSYQVFKGTAFALVDQAVDFVMSKINLRVGTRAESARAPVAYEIPREVVAEAIVNAVAHRDYTSNGSVQVMLFEDRLEVWNPGTLPASLTLKKLREAHGSVPANPLLAEPLYLARYIERMGTGTGDMIRRCRDLGLPEPEFDVSDGFQVTIRRPESQDIRPESRPESEGRRLESKAGQLESRLESGEERLESAPTSLEGKVLAMIGTVPKSKAEMSRELGHRQVSGQLHKVLRLLLADQMIEWTIPDKPNSRLQRYRITEKGAGHLESLKKGRGAR